VRVNGREWPPDPVTPGERKKKSPPESWLVVFLLPGAPLITWILAMLAPDGNHRQWALLAWPVGWLVALIVTLVSIYVRERDTK
jgi:hypothetical protein